jgi:hypothetical protein
VDHERQRRRHCWRTWQWCRWGGAGSARHPRACTATSPGSGGTSGPRRDGSRPWTVATAWCWTTTSWTLQGREPSSRAPARPRHGTRPRHGCRAQQARAAGSAGRRPRLDAGTGRRPSAQRRPRLVRRGDFVPAPGGLRRIGHIQPYSVAKRSALSATGSGSGGPHGARPGRRDLGSCRPGHAAVRARGSTTWSTPCSTTRRSPRRSSRRSSRTRRGSSSGRRSTVVLGPPVGAVGLSFRTGIRRHALSSVRADSRRRRRPRRRSESGPEGPCRIHGWLR